MDQITEHKLFEQTKLAVVNEIMRLGYARHKPEGVIRYSMRMCCFLGTVAVASALIGATSLFVYIMITS
jgi:hypothetical protein